MFLNLKFNYSKSQIKVFVQEWVVGFIVASIITFVIVWLAVKFGYYIIK